MAACKLAYKIFKCIQHYHNLLFPLIMRVTEETRILDQFPEKMKEVCNFQRKDSGRRFNAYVFSLVILSLGFCVHTAEVKSIQSSYVNAETILTQDKTLEKTMTGGGLQGAFDTIDIDIDNIKVDSNYTGPKLEDGKVTLKFMEDLIKAYNSTQKLHEKYVYMILREVKSYLKKQPTLLDVNVPDGKNITVVGDIHGQFFDLLHIFEMNKLPSEKNRYLFNGDLVDRGDYSMECIVLLFGFKLLYPDAVFLNRGNHETQKMNDECGFANDCRRLYSGQMMDAFTEVFQWLPLAHRINKKVLVLHAGLFQKRHVTLEDIKNIKRNVEPKVRPTSHWLPDGRGKLKDGDEDSLLLDILWSDPHEANGRCLNSQRGGSIKYGPDVTESFCTRNKLDYIIRSHHPKPSGYEVTHNRRLITVFSAPNYYHRNLGAILQLRAPELKPSFVTFEKAKQPGDSIYW